MFSGNVFFEKKGANPSHKYQQGINTKKINQKGEPMVGGTSVSQNPTDNTSLKPSSGETNKATTISNNAK